MTKKTTAKEYYVWFNVGSVMTVEASCEKSAEEYFFDYISTPHGHSDIERRILENLREGEIEVYKIEDIYD